MYLIEFQLTEHGESHVSEIIVEFFAFVQFISNLEITASLFKEISNFSKFSFLFNISSEFTMFEQVQQDNFERVLDFSEKLLNFGPEQIFTADQIWGDFKPGDFLKVLQNLQPRQAVFMFQSEKFKKVEKEKIKTWKDDDINGVTQRLSQAEAIGTF